MGRLADYQNARVFSKRATRQIVWLIVLSSIPAGLAIAYAVVHDAWLLAAVVYIVTLVADAWIMLVIRSKQPLRDQ